MIPRLLMSLAVAAEVVALVAHAGGPPDPVSAALTPDAVRNELIRSQEALARKFQDCRDNLQRRAQRLECGPRSEDRALADILKKALSSSFDGAFDAHFAKATTALRSPQAIGLKEVHQALELAANHFSDDPNLRKQPDLKIPRRADGKGLWEWSWAPGDPVKLHISAKGFASHQLEIAGGAPVRTVALNADAP